MHLRIIPVLLYYITLMLNLSTVSENELPLRNRGADSDSFKGLLSFRFNRARLQSDLVVVCNYTSEQALRHLSGQTCIRSPHVLPVVE